MLEELECKPWSWSVSWRVTQWIDGVKLQGDKDAPVKIINHAGHRHSRTTWHEVWAGYHLPITLHSPCFWTPVAARSLIFQSTGRSRHKMTPSETFFFLRNLRLSTSAYEDAGVLRKWRAAFDDLEMAKSNLGVKAPEKSQWMSKIVLVSNLLPKTGKYVVITLWSNNSITFLNFFAS